MKRQPLALDSMNDLRLAELVVRWTGRLGRFFFVLAVRPTVIYAEYRQTSREDRGKDHEFAAFGLEKFDKFRRGHGFSIVLVDMAFALGKANGPVKGWEIKQFTSTVKSFLSESSFRPPSGVPVMAK